MIIKLSTYAGFAQLTLSRKWASPLDALRKTIFSFPHSKAGAPFFLYLLFHLDISEAESLVISIIVADLTRLAFSRISHNLLLQTWIVTALACHLTNHLPAKYT